MAWIAFLGCDGAGKSAVIEGVSAKLKAGGVAVSRGHWRPRAFGGQASDEEIAAASDPHGRPPRGGVASVLKLGWIWFNWWAGWLTGLRRASRDGCVLYDRYHADLLVDPRRYRYGGPAWLARLVSSCMPQPDRVIFLDAPVDVLLSRKQEVPAEKLEVSRGRYLALCRGHRRFRVVDASRPLAEVIAAVEREIGD